MGGWVDGWARRGVLSLLQLTTERTSAVRSNAYGGTPDGSGLPAIAVSYTRSEWPSCNRVGMEGAIRMSCSLMWWGRCSCHMQTSSGAIPWLYLPRLACSRSTVISPE